MKRIAIFGTDWNTSEYRKKNNLYGGVTYYRLIKPLVHLKGYEVDYYGANLLDIAKNKTVVEFWGDMMDKYDLFITKAIDNEEAIAALVFFCRKFNKKIILDLDDNLFEVKSDQPAYELYKPTSPKRVALATFLSMVDGIFVSTQPLKDYYEKYLKDVFNIDTPIFVLPNYCDLEDWNFKPVKKDPKKITIGWIGSTTHFNDLKLVIPAMERILKENKNVEFNLVGGLTEEDAIKLFSKMADEVLNRVYVSSGTEAWEGYPEFVSKLTWDIGIAPLTGDTFNRCKSHIKWMEYAAYKIPCVASRVYPYHQDILDKKAIEDGVTGMLCDDKEWYYKLNKLVQNKKLRTTIGNNAYKYIKKNLQYKDKEKLWLDAVSKFL